MLVADAVNNNDHDNNRGLFSGVVLWLCMYFLGACGFWVLNRTASPLGVGCGCNEHSSLGAVVNRSFLPETSENVLQKFEPPSYLEKVSCSTL